MGSELSLIHISFNPEASVPQAPALMNGSLLPEVLGPFSQIMLTVTRAKNLDQQEDADYLTLLSRQPTAHEKQACLEALQRGSDAKDLVYVVLNTQQFIFLQ